MLEEACFGFAQRYLPSVVQGTRFDCPAAVELTRWAKILTSHRDGLGATVAPSFKSPSFQDLMASIRRLRHTAVHRIPVSTAVVCQLVSSAADLAEMLQDKARTGLIRDFYRNIETGYKETHAVRQVLRANADRELEEVRRAREELNRREKDIVAKILSEDAERRRELGQRLERAVGQAIAEWESWTAASTRDSLVHSEALEPVMVEGDTATARGLSETSRVESRASSPLPKVA